MNHFRRSCETAEGEENESGDGYVEVIPPCFPQLPIFNRVRSAVTRNFSQQKGVVKGGIPKRLFPDRMSKWSDGGRRKR